ncbi:MAG: Rrf2 family transcriptional regulator [Endomicrobiia bacterium]
MKISTKTDYAFRLLLELALNYDKFLKYGNILRMKDISKKHNIPYKFLQQIVLQLKKFGYIRTIQGVKGGICLAKHPKQIILGDVIKLLEGNLLQIVCFEENFSKKCKEKNCVFVPIWQQIDKQLQEIVNNISFEDIVNKYLSSQKRLEYFI